MKNVILFTALLFSCHVFCQSDVPASQDDTVFTMAEQMPEYPGGEQALMKFVATNVVYPKMERENDIQGRVLTKFVVNEDGSLSDIRIIRSVSPGIDAEAMRLIGIMPKFKPGMQQGKAVKVSFVLPIMFKLSEPTPANK